MPRREDDQIGHVPKIAPAHDEVASFQRARKKGKLASSLGEVPDVPAGAVAGSSALTKTVLALVVVGLIATAGGAGYLYMQLNKAQGVIDNYELRISALEQQLQVTDESMNESSVALKVKVRELDSEIRKLWDNVWKRSKERFAEQEAALEKHEKRLDEVQKFASSAQQQFDKTTQVVSGLTAQLKAAEQMKASVSANSQQLKQQITSLEAVADKLNRLSSDLNKLDKRVAGNEEWVESINGFRRQVNREISTLKQSLGQPATL